MLTPVLAQVTVIAVGLTIRADAEGGDTVRVTGMVTSGPGALISFMLVVAVLLPELAS